MVFVLPCFETEGKIFASFMEGGGEGKKEKLHVRCIPFQPRSSPGRRGRLRSLNTALLSLFTRPRIHRRSAIRETFCQIGSGRNRGGYRNYVSDRRTFLAMPVKAYTGTRPSGRKFSVLSGNDKFFQWTPWKILFCQIKPKLCVIIQFPPLSILLTAISFISNILFRNLAPLNLWFPANFSN